MLALLLGRLAVQSRPLQPLRAQTHRYFEFCVCAVSEALPEEAFGVAFVEGGDYVGAAWEERLLAKCGEGQASMREFGGGSGLGLNAVGREVLLF